MPPGSLNEIYQLLIIKMSPAERKAFTRRWKETIKELGFEP